MTTCNVLRGARMFVNSTAAGAQLLTRHSLTHILRTCIVRHVHVHSYSRTHTRIHVRTHVCT
jgi:hypothetical protein